jgi:hypothetical protein
MSWSVCAPARPNEKKKAVPLINAKGINHRRYRMNFPVARCLNPYAYLPRESTPNLRPGICRVFAQLTWREGLRDIVTGLNARAEALYRLGFREPMRRAAWNVQKGEPGLVSFESHELLSFGHRQIPALFPHLLPVQSANPDIS